MMSFQAFVRNASLLITNRVQINFKSKMSDKSSHKSTQKFQNISHIIFDLDGTLIDTELWGLNNCNTLLAKHNKHCSSESYAKLVGLDTLERAQHLIEDFKLPDYTKETFLEEWVNECRQHLGDIQLMPGVERVLEHFKKHDIPLAIATSGKKLEYLAKTYNLSNVFEEGKYFQHIIHGDDQRVKQVKPFPDLFQICVSEFKPIPDPKNVLVFEDNIIGISAAVAAGMPSVLVNDIRFSAIKESDANLIIQSLDVFKPEHFGLPAF